MGAISTLDKFLGQLDETGARLRCLPLVVEACPLPYSLFLRPPLPLQATTRGGDERGKGGGAADRQTPPPSRGRRAVRSTSRTGGSGRC